MKPVQYKYTPQLFKSVLDVDDKSRRVKVVLNKCGVLDSDKDIVDRNAFNKTIQEWGPKGSNRIWHLLNHNSFDLIKGLNKFSELGMNGDDLEGVTDILKTTTGDDALEFYRSGAITEHSIGFVVTKRQTMNEETDNRYDLIQEVQLYEGSAVLWGANQYTPTLSVGKNLKSLTIMEKADIFKTLTDQMIGFTKLLEKGKLSDDGFILLEYSIKQIQTSLSELFENFTLADEKSLEPKNEEVKEDDELLKQLLLINTKLKSL